MQQQMSTRVGLVAAGLLAMACAPPWQPSEAVDDRTHGTTQDPQPVAAFAGDRAVAVWNREVWFGTSHDPPSVRHTWARVHDGTSWTDYVDLGSETARPKVAGSADGSAIAVVDDGAARYAAGAWSAPEPVPFGDTPRIAMDATGHALVVGSAGGNTQGTFFDPATGWGLPLSLGAGVSERMVAMSATGAAVVAWCSGSEVWANVADAAHTWSGAQHVLDNCSAASVGGIELGTTALDVGISDAGVAFVVNGTAAGIGLATYTPGSGFGPGVVIAPGVHFSFPQLVVNSSGAALLAYNASYYPFVIEARYFRPGSGWAGPFAVAASSRASRKGVGIDAAGNGHVMYVASGASLTADVWSNDFTASSLSFSGPISLESLGGVAYYLSGATAANGRTIAIWTHDAVTPSERIEAARYVP